MFLFDWMSNGDWWMFYVVFRRWMMKYRCNGWLYPGNVKVWKGFWMKKFSKQGVNLSLRELWSDRTLLPVGLEPYQKLRKFDEFAKIKTLYVIAYCDSFLHCFFILFLNLSCAYVLSTNNTSNTKEALNSKAWIPGRNGAHIAQRHQDQGEKESTVPTSRDIWRGLLALGCFLL